jgi:uncharacterized protein YigA (DUF484 family)
MREHYLISERKFKEDIINFRQKIEEKDVELKQLSSDKEILRYENEKFKSEMKNYESHKTNNESFFSQINDLQIKLTDKEVIIII